MTCTYYLSTCYYARMPFGIRNKPATSQRALDSILSGVRRKTCLVYVDDISIFSKHMSQPVKDIGEVLALLPLARVTLKATQISTH